MDWDAIGAIGEVVGAAAVVVTLVFLIHQIKQNTRSVRQTAETALSHHVAAWSAEVVRNPDLGRIWDVAATDPESLTDDEKRVYLWYVTQLFELYEGHFNLFAEGQVPEHSWMPKAQFMARILTLPLVDVWWHSRLAPLSDGFVEHIDTVRKSIPADEKLSSVLSEALGDR